MRGPDTVSRLDVIRMAAHLALAAPTDACVLAPTEYVKPNGYAEVSWMREHLLAHRVAYEVAQGPIPSGLQVDHVCHSNSTDCAGGSSCLHRRCINPAHLEAVTAAENTRRAKALITHCPRRHEYTAANTGRTATGARRCRACGREKAAERKRSTRQITRQHTQPQGATA